MLTDPAVMVAVFRVLVHLALAAAAISQIVLIGAVIWKFSPRMAEIIMRSAAAVCGLLLYLGAKAFGLSIPTFLLYALTQGGAYVTGIVGSLFPAATGFLVAWFERKNIVAMRILALVMTMVFFLFMDTYVATFDVAHGEDFKLLMPNMTFVLAILLYAIFRYQPPPDEPSAAAA